MNLSGPLNYSFAKNAKNNKGMMRGFFIQEGTIF